MIQFDLVDIPRFPTHYIEGQQFTTEVVGVEYSINPVILLKYIGEEYNPKDPQCLFPVQEELDAYIHPFVD